MKFGYRIFFIIAVIIFFLSCFYYYPFISDDSLISLRYVQRFIEGKGLNWTDGHPVEGYSNFLWILGVSVLGKLGIDLIVAARILGILCSIGTIWTILTYFRTQPVKKELVFLAVTLLVTTPCFAVWAIGGLEQPLYVLLVTLTFVEVLRIVSSNDFRKIYHLSVWLGLLALTRPDGYLFTIITSLFLLFVYRQKKELLLKIGIATIFVPTLFLISQLVFRYVYYGELVPNTALVKVKITIHHILRGGFYHVKAFFGTLLLSLLGLYGMYILVFKKKNVFGFYILLITTAWVSYVTLVGGDIFPAFRHYYVVLIFFTFAIILGLDAINLNKINFSNNKFISGVIAVLILNAFIQTQFKDNQNAVNERWEFRGMKLGERLKVTFPDKTLIAVTAAGCIPYSSELPAIDMLGLNDYYIPRHPPADFGTGPLAHELGDARYVMSRHPDIIIFNTGAPLLFNIGDQLKANKTFNSDYIKLLATERGAEYIMFLNKYGKHAGIKMTENELKIPGYLFTHPKDTTSAFIGQKLLKAVYTGSAYEISLLDIPNKKWNVKSIESSKNVKFQTTIVQESQELKVFVKPNQNALLESVVLIGKD
ncbi:hypothetical protein [uncultured Chryseobacterium sp.]|uniref:hypothetical protein n=1 Tax=uncultured Chryseobacterium sp. TaxID=259322 RepID=UPI0026215742|nr:hypothetical protein [uncultured Chryseobacterium sp.]